MKHFKIITIQTCFESGSTNTVQSIASLTSLFGIKIATCSDPSGTKKSTNLLLIGKIEMSPIIKSADPLMRVWNIPSPITIVPFCKHSGEPTSRPFCICNLDVKFNYFSRLCKTCTKIGL